MLLNCEHSSCLLSCLSDDILIDRLDSVDVDEFSIYTVSSEHIHSLHSLRYTKSCSYDRYVLAVLELNPFADLKLVCALIIEYWNCQSSKSEIYRSNILVCSFHCCSCLYIITWVNDNHAWYLSHECDILTALMCCSILTY